MDVCEYCGECYHPMPVYVLRKLVFGKKAEIHVCHVKFDEKTEQLVKVDECRKKAEADGYEFRPDLTPRR